MRILLLYLLLIGSLYAHGQTDPPKANDTTDTEQQTRFTGYTVFFETGSTNIKASFETDLAALARQMKETNRAVTITGFTDDVGQAEANLDLSRRRAEAVKDYLEANGADSMTFEIKFAGEDQPVGDNATASGRAQNRRVEISYDETVLSEEIYEEAAADDLMTNFKPPEGSRLIEREMPKPKEPNGLKLEFLQDEIVSSNGATVMLPFKYKSGNSRPQRVIMTAKGANSFYVIPLTVTSVKGNMRIPLGLSTELGEGQFDVVASLVNADNQISKPDTISVIMNRLGTGRLQISLSWDTSTDQDLHVITPSGERIFFRDRSGEFGGQLDRDDQDGQGPENIFWDNEAPDGVYTIEVDDYWGTSTENNFVVTFNGMGTSKQFFGTTIDGSQVTVCRFRKVGEMIEFIESE
ncbi:MAG: OmpA family protein [Bacteroidota bacterium]